MLELFRTSSRVRFSSRFRLLFHHNVKYRNSDEWGSTYLVVHKRLNTEEEGNTNATILLQ